MMAEAAARDVERARRLRETAEPRCVGHYIGAGYSHHGLAKNCPHAECKALAAAHNSVWVSDA